MTMTTCTQYTYVRTYAPTALDLHNIAAPHECICIPAAKQLPVLLHSSLSGSSGSRGRAPLKGEIEVASNPDRKERRSVLSSSVEPYTLEESNQSVS